MAENRNYGYNDYSVYGNTVLAPEQNPEREKQKNHKKKKRILPRTAVDILPVAYVFVVGISCAVILAFSVMLLHARTQVTIQSEKVSVLQTKLENLKQENQDLQNEILASTTLDTIRTRAEELGMKQAKESQMIFYTSSDSEYVRQKDDIPND